MMHLNLSGPATKDFKILCLGAHSDDIEIGCGGTILRFAEMYPNCLFHWVVFSAIGIREAEARQAAAQFVPRDRLKGLHLKTFADGFMPFSGAELKHTFEEFKKTLNPDFIFSHNRKDSHQDHRLIAELTWNTFRDHLILEYEVPKYDGDMGQPSLFVPLSLEQCERKIRYLVDTFESQRQKRWFEPETFRALMRLRGMECNSSSGYAEAFYSRKLILGG
jgi:LmbE family N-acetylglucosaminyl deacetylase